MKRTYYSYLLIAAAALAVCACESPVSPLRDESHASSTAKLEAASKASVDHFRVMFPLPLQLPIPCIDEEVAVGDGVRYLFVHEVTSDNGYLFRFHLNHSRITGIGTETGDEYVGQFVLNTQEVSFTEKGRTMTFQEHIHGVSKGSSPNWFLFVLVHLTLNENGDLTADTEIVDAECRGWMEEKRTRRNVAAGRQSTVILDLRLFLIRRMSAAESLR